ncbi:hypothetical protein JTB14_005558 [Gonioctena quinquepunctata]|nr:hypothetical protein JTB14_005558 [Gonioctena quinquepunctata]
MMDVHVKFEHPRKKVRTGQCYKCQQFGHTAYTCRTTPVCRHCAGHHEFRSHPKDDKIPTRCSNCNGEHESNYWGCPYSPESNNSDGFNSRRPPRPPRSQEERNIGNQGNNPGTSENSTLRKLSAAMDELRELIIRRPILAGLIQLKTCQGAETLSSSN